MSGMPASSEDFMTTRRTIIQSLAASALPLAGVTAATSASEAQRLERPPKVWLLYRFLVDDRYRESVDAAAVAAERGVSVHTMNGGDITPFWFNDLSLRWQRIPAVVAGVTGHGPLFVLEQLARDYGMRVIVRAEHRRAANGSTLHELSGPGHWVAQMAALSSACDWTKPIGAALTQCAIEPCSVAHLIVAHPSTVHPASGSGDVEPLFSWLIGPGSGRSKASARG
jgi:hypothetical protein